MRDINTFETAGNAEHLQEPALRYARRDFPVIRHDVTVGEALEIIRREGIGERIIYFYITNDLGQLAGIIPTRRLLTSMPHRPVAEIMITDVIKISDRATVREACEEFVKHKLFAFPIVDERNQIRGVIDIGFFSEETINVTQRQKIGDIFELIGFGMTQLEGRSAVGVLRYRLPSLLTVFASGLICAMILNTYRLILAKNLVLILFLVLIVALSESVSAQSMTVALQHLHFGKPTWRRYQEWVQNETLTTLLLGLVCGALVGTSVGAWQGRFLEALTIGGSVLMSMVVAGIAGVTIPTLLHATREDPKIAAGPLTHALTLITTLLIYLGSTALLLGN